MGLRLGRARTREVEVYVIRPRMNAARYVLSLLFWVWGIGGLVTLPGGLIPIGTALSVLHYIAGLVLFGLGTLLAGTSYAVIRRETDDVGDVRITRQEPGW
jgi:hypothetical protein